MCENPFIARRLFGFSLRFPLELAEHDEFIRVGLLAAAIDFQIAQDKRASPIALQKDEWIRRPELRRVKHVGIGLACGDDETGRFRFSFAHVAILLRSIRIHVIQSEGKDLPKYALSQKKNFSNPNE